MKEAMFGRRKKDNGVSKEKNDEDELLKVRDLRAGRRCNEADKMKDFGVIDCDVMKSMQGL